MLKQTPFQSLDKTSTNFKGKKRKFVEFAKSECAKVGSGVGDQQVQKFE